MNQARILDDLNFLSHAFLEKVGAKKEQALQDISMARMAALARGYESDSCEEEENHELPSHSRGNRISLQVGRNGQARIAEATNSPFSFAVTSETHSDSGYSNQGFCKMVHPKWAHQFKRYTSFLTSQYSWKFNNAMEMSKAGFFLFAIKTLPEQMRLFFLWKDLCRMVRKW